MVLFLSTHFAGRGKICLFFFFTLLRYIYEEAIIYGQHVEIFLSFILLYEINISLYAINNRKYK
jgi:hypothetical protein